MSTTAVWKKYGDFLRQNFYKEHTFGLTDISYFQLGMSVKRPSRNILKTKGSSLPRIFHPLSLDLGVFKYDFYKQQKKIQGVLFSVFLSM